MTRATPPFGNDVQCVDAIEFDEFEQQLLPVVRLFVQAFETPEDHSWHRAFALSADTWQEPVGLSIAHRLQKLVRSVLRCRGWVFQANDPRFASDNDRLTEDESLLLGMLHHMRRDDTKQARGCVERLTRGFMDPDVIRNGLSFAARFPSGPQTQPRNKYGRPKLYVV